MKDVVEKFVNSVRYCVYVYCGQAGRGQGTVDIDSMISGPFVPVGNGVWNQTSLRQWGLFMVYVPL